MNGYAIQLNTLLNYLDKHPEEGQALRGKLNALTYVVKFDKKDLCELFNTGAFNEIVLGYVTAAAAQIGADKEIVEATRQQFDIFTAEDAIDLYLSV